MWTLKWRGLLTTVIKVGFVDGPWDERVLLINVFLDSARAALEDVWWDASCCLPLIRWWVKRRTRRQRLSDRGGRKRQVSEWRIPGAWPQKSELPLLSMKSRLLEERRDGKHREERCLVTAGCSSIYNSCASSKNSQYAVIPRNNRTAWLGSFTNPSDRWLQTEGAH